MTTTPEALPLTAEELAESSPWNADASTTTEYRKLELAWKEACIARDDYKQLFEATDALWVGAYERANKLEAENTALAAQVQDLLTRLEKMEGNQRRPGTMEVCEVCHDDLCVADDCNRIDCPFVTALPGVG